MRVIEAGVGAAWCVDWSPDGARIAVGGHEGLIVWTVEGREVWRAVEQGQDAVVAVAWSPEGRWIAAAHHRPTDSGRVVWHPPQQGGTSNVAWSPDGTRLAAAVTGASPVIVRNARTGREEGRFAAAVTGATLVLVWDVCTGRDERRLLVEGRWVPNSVAWSPDGSRLATGSGGDGTPGAVHVWAPAAAEPLVKTLEHTTTVRSVRWSPDGRQLFFSSDDGTVRVRDVASGVEISRMRARDRDRLGFGNVAVSLHGRLLAAGSHRMHDDGGAHHLAHVWDAAAEGRRALLCGHTDSAWGVAFAPDGRSLATASPDGTVRVWDVADLWAQSEPIEQRQRSSLASDVARRAAPAGQRAPCEEPPPFRWDGIEGRRLAMWQRRRAEPWAGALAFSKDGTCLFLGDFKSLECRHLATGQVVWSISRALMSTSNEYDLAVSPDGRLLAGAVESEVAVWDATTGREVCRAQDTRASNALSPVAWSPDGMLLLSGGRALNAFTGETVFEHDGHCAAWSPTNQWLTTADARWRIHVHDPDTRAKRRTLSLHTDSIGFLDASPDGQRLATASSDCTIALVRPLDPDPPRRLIGHTARVSCIRWSPDGRRLASASSDGTARLWDAASGAELACFDARELDLPGVRGQEARRVQRVVWSPDGQVVATCHQGELFCLWDVRR